MISTEIIETKSGKIEGYKNKQGMEIFKGIPYAEPPIGKLRFNPPIEKQSWSGIFKATDFSPVSLQATGPLTPLFPKHDNQSESDCLTLNIYTPACDNQKRPVMFWIHGGAFLEGAGGDPSYEGSTLAQRGDIVVVTINYRLGVLGFLFLPGITANIGLLDQIAALKWVRDNIEAFGGNPDMVTIAGQSAGGISAAVLPVMPTAKGLFHRIIAQSTPFLETKPTMKNTRSLLRILKIKKGDLDGLRKLPFEQITEAENLVCAKDATDVMPFRPVVDGDTLPIHPIKAFQNGNCKEYELMIGHNLDDANLFTHLDPSLSKMIEIQGENVIIGFMGTFGVDNVKANEILDIYKENRKDVGKVLDDLTTDAVFRINTIRLLDAQSKHQSNTFNYIFTWPSPGFGGNVGSLHCIELPFVFGTLDVPEFVEFTGKGPDVETLSKKTMDTWISFVRNGNPNNEGIPEWPPYDTEKRETMFIGKECKVVAEYKDKERIAWDGFLEV